MARSYFVYSYDPPIYWRVGDASGQALSVLYSFVEFNPPNDNDNLKLRAV